MRPFTWKTDGLVIGIALLAPACMTWLYFYVLAGQGLLTRSIYLGSKIALGLLPISWYLWLRWDSMRATSIIVLPPKKPNHQLSFRLGLDFGLFTVAGMLFLYYVCLKDSSVLQGTPAIVQAKLLDAGVTSLATFVVMAGFLAFLHSAYEEYYWRWFIFGRLRDKLPWWQAALISSFGFMLHHILVLWAFLPADYGILLVITLSLCIGIGGYVWCCIYQYTGSLLGAWVAHLLADLGIMWCGYDMCRAYFH